jgi:2,3-bisphosphoglycerate-independent phosphoglycerate mutase
MNQINKPAKGATKPDKCILIIIDGMGDLPVPELAGKTPLEAAHTPVLDRLAGSGRYGQVNPIIPGEIPNTHSGTGMLMGLLPEQAERLSRGPVESAGRGWTLSKGDIAVRANFATAEHIGKELKVTDRRAGRISNDTKALAACLSDIDLGDGIRGSLLPTDQHRGVLILIGPGLDASVSDTDPGSSILPAAAPACRPLKPGAALTASKINAFVREAHRRLADHPVNLARVRDGRLPANFILTRGAGSQFELDNVLIKRGIRVAAVAGCNTVRGLSRIFGFDVIVDSRFTATFETDVQAKIETAISALRDHDMVFVHFKAPDICSHDLKPLAKRDFLQRIDAAMQPLLEAGVVIAIGADHTTDSNTGFHTAEPVPALICPAYPGQCAETVKFGESLCRQGNMDRQLSCEFLLRVLDTMGYPDT